MKIGQAFVASAAICVGLLGSSAALAQEATAPGVHEHDGFMLRLAIGGGYGQSSTTVLNESWAISGPGSLFSLALGGRVTDSLIIHGEMYGATLFSPKFKIGGQTFEAIGDTSLTMAGLGPGVTYYFMPINLYASATIAASFLSLQHGGASGSAKPGFGTNIMVGKEWWVSDNWGIGLAGQFLFQKNSDTGPGADISWTSLGGGLAFSATYN